MEYKFDHTNRMSLLGSMITSALTYLSHVSKDDVVFFMAVISFVVTVGYTMDKWYRMRKGQKITD